MIRSFTLDCPGGVFRVDGATAATLGTPGTTGIFWTIDGAAANHRETFFPALAAALAFPDYFGHNWDAAYDCLTDLAGGDLSPAVITITAGETFLHGMGAEWEKGHRVFTDAAAFWRAQGRLLLVLLVAGEPLPGISDVPPACLHA